MSDGKTHLTIADVMTLAHLAHERICEELKLDSRIPKFERIRIFGIPRGGVPAAIALCAAAPDHYVMTSDVLKAHVIFDDLVDSGATRTKFMEQFSRYKGIPPKFHALIDKPNLPPDHPHRGWIVFPWEGNEYGSFEDNVRRTLQYVGENPLREGLRETPHRVTKAWNFWCSGYREDPEEILKSFEDGGEGYDEMVMVKDIPIYSKCEHHMADIFGTATIAYIPDGRVVGLSKLSRLANIFARRLQVQERLTVQIADTLFKSSLKPKGVGVILRCRHMCMESRGLCQQGHHTITSALRGVMLSGEPRAEFLKLAESNKAC